MIKVTSFYKFFPIKKQELKIYKEKLCQRAESLGLRGLMLLGEEGLNSTLCGKEDSLENFKSFISDLFKQKFFWKDSYCETWNFKRLSIKIKKEIINIGDDCKPPYENQHLSPQEWEEKLKNQPQVLDVRNNYEVELGKFKGAKDLNMDTFQEFSEKLDQYKLDKNKETLIYCTGGIRCEKALQIMEHKGFSKVYQLSGGILNYLKEYPNSQFERECFVFDHRTAVDQNLKASKNYSLCPHCGQPGDLSINCKHCEKPAVICDICKKKALYYETCSKNCSYHFKSGHTCRKKYQTQSLQK